MKWLSAISLAALFVTSNAQRSFIGSPADGATVSSGSKLVVQVIRPNSIQGSTEVGLAIALQSCPKTTGDCLPPSQRLGTILYSGPYNPVLHEQPGRPYQNFTVVVPDGVSLFFPKGRAQLSVTRLHLIGAGPSPVLEFNNLTLNVK